MKRSKRIRLLGIYLILMILSTFCDAIFYDNHWLVAVFSSTLNIFTAAFFYLLGSIPTSEKNRE